jgi:hypothetical protein
MRRPLALGLLACLFLAGLCIWGAARLGNHPVAAAADPAPARSELGSAPVAENPLPAPSNVPIEIAYSNAGVKLPQPAYRNEYVDRMSAARQIEAAQPRAQVTEADIQQQVGKDFARPDWADSGFGSISSLIETYYWAMREHNLHRFSECLSPVQWVGWEDTMRGREEAVVAEMSRAVQDVEAYRIRAITNLLDGGCFVAITHSAGRRRQVLEKFAVVKVGNDWKIAGFRGDLYYPHRAGLLGKYEP